jgi:hypothetical protein
MKKSIILLILAISISPLSGFSLTFYSDDPIWTDPDQSDYPKPLVKEIGRVHEIISSTLTYPRKNRKYPPGTAININTLGEVPDSSWFTNRIGRNPMTIDELVRGPNTVEAPDNSIWTIVEAKSQGITPGFVIQDGRGDRYIIKFDPKMNPQLASSAEVISTKFFYAFGYNVPENYLAMMTPEILVVSPTAIITDENGQKRKMTQHDVDKILKRVPVNPDGTIQVLASKQIPGEPIGQFSYFGKRSDDANDIFNHQDRRELRALKVFASWLNHDEANSTNSLDVYIGKDKHGSVKHYLLDFGSTLGSDTVKIQSKRRGNEYIFEKKPMLKSAVSFGLIDRPWRSVKYPDFPSIGRFEADFFDASRWKPEFPNPAFDRMLPDDGFWAARILSRVNDERVRAVVKSARYMDSKAEDYMVQTLIKRRDKIIRYYLQQVNPIDEFIVDSSGLKFTHSGTELGIGTVNGFEYQWHRFDNQTGSTEPIGERQTTMEKLIPIPAGNSEFLMVSIRGTQSAIPAWNQDVSVYLRTTPALSLVGIER